jgi:hypothetical protein
MRKSDFDAVSKLGKWRRRLAGLPGVETASCGGLAKTYHIYRISIKLAIAPQSRNVSMERSQPRYQAKRATGAA